MTDYQTNSDGTVTVTGDAGESLTVHWSSRRPRATVHFLVNGRFCCGTEPRNGHVGTDAAGMLLAWTEAHSADVCGECMPRAAVSVVRRVQHLEALVDRLLLMHANAARSHRDVETFGFEGDDARVTVTRPGRPFPPPETEPTP